MLTRSSPRRRKLPWLLAGAAVLVLGLVLVLLRYHAPHSQGRGWGEEQWHAARQRNQALLRTDPQQAARWGPTALLASLTDAQLNLLSRGRALTYQDMTPEQRVLAEFQLGEGYRLRFGVSRVRIERLEPILAGYRMLMRDVRTGKSLTIAAGG